MIKFDELIKKSLIIGMLMIGGIFCSSPVVAVNNTTVTFKFLKQYQQLCLKTQQKIDYTFKQTHERQVVLVFKQMIQVRTIKNLPNFISISPVKNNTKKLVINFGKSYKVANFQQGNALYLDLYPTINLKKSLLKNPLPPLKPALSESPPQSALPKPQLPEKPLQNLSHGSLEIYRSAAQEALILKNNDPLPVVAFNRGKHIYILWPNELNLKNGILPLIPGITKIERLTNKYGTIGLLLTVKPYCQISLLKQKDQWLLRLKKNVSQQDYKWHIQRTNQGKAICIIENVKVEKIERFTDPYTENIFYVVYSHNDQKRLEKPLETMEMKVHPSLIGIVCEPYQSDVLLSFQENNLVISTPEGLIISNEEERSRMVTPNPKNFFKFYEWEKDKKSWLEKRTALTSRLHQGDSQHLSSAYFDLIKFYLSTGFAEEAYSFLQKMVQKDPLQQENEMYLGLLAITQVLRGFYQEALVIFKEYYFCEENEIALWTALTQLCLGQNIADSTIFERNVEFLKNYPAYIKMKFIFVAVEYFLKNNQPDKAKKMLSLVTRSELEPLQQEELKYLNSLLAYREGKTQEAIGLWEDLGQDFKTRIGVEANLALLDHQIAHGILPPQKIIKQLKSFRFRWRDDEIELRIVKKLIEYYLQQKQYRLAFNEMRYLENNFSEVLDIQEIRQQIQEQLIQLYHQPHDKNFSLLTALGLYTDYKSYFPKDERMKAVRLSLAEKLITIGLLDQAIAMLNDQLKEVSLDEKEVIGARIAEICLQNEMPQEALKVLGETAGTSIVDDLLNHRQLIEAQSLGMLKKYDEALAIIHHRIDKKAMLLKRDLLLNANRWTEAGEILQEFLEKEHINNNVLNTEQSQLILDLAVTAALSKKFPLLNNLRLRYLALMQKTELASFFDLVTQRLEPVKVMNEAALHTAIEKSQEFELLLMTYQARLKKNLI